MELPYLCLSMLQDWKVWIKDKYISARLRYVSESILSRDHNWASKSLLLRKKWPRLWCLISSCVPLKVSTTNIQGELLPPYDFYVCTIFIHIHLAYASNFTAWLFTIFNTITDAQNPCCLDTIPLLDPLSLGLTAHWGYCPCKIHTTSLFLPLN